MHQNYKENLMILIILKSSISYPYSFGNFVLFLMCNQQSCVLYPSSLSQVLTWGVRQLKDYKMLPIESPHADIEIGGETITIDKIPSLKKHPNFAVPFVYFDVWLPVREEFLPPINIRVMDNR